MLFTPCSCAKTCCPSEYTFLQVSPELPAGIGGDDFFAALGSASFMAAEFSPASGDDALRGNHGIDDRSFANQA